MVASVDTVETIRNPLTKDQMTRLGDAVRSSSMSLRHFRDQRNEAIRQYCGGRYVENSTIDKTPVNLLEMAVTIYVVNLVVTNPRVNIVTPHKQLKADAKDLAIATNRMIETIELGMTLQNIVRDAIFGLGVIRTGLADADDDWTFGSNITGAPFADRVDLDDLVIDLSARTWREVQFIGNKYRRRLIELKEDDSFDQKEVAKLEPLTRTEVDESGIEKAESLTERTSADARDDFEDWVELTDIYLPDYKVILTVRDTKLGWTKALRCVEWEGPRRGPYHILSFHDVPNNVLPLPPAQIWMELHELGNELFRKMFRQATRQKTIFAVDDTVEDDGDTLINARDGQMVKLNTDGIKEVRYGGADQATAGAAVMSKDLFFTVTGNLDTLGGLSASSPTATQDQLINASANKRLQFMQGRLGKFTRGVVRDLAWMLYTDPSAELTLSKDIAGYDIRFAYGPDRRGAPFSSYDIGIDVYSMVEQTPMAKAQNLMEIFGTVIAPLIPMIQQQGGAVDARKLLEILSDYRNLSPELKDIIKFSGAPQDDGQAPSDRNRPRQAAQTKRTYERVNRPGAMRAQKDADMAQMLFGGSVQDKQAASLVRDIN